MEPNQITKSQMWQRLWAQSIRRFRGRRRNGCDGLVWRSSLNISSFSFILLRLGRLLPSVKNYAGRQPMRVPIALHNTLSAMGLLHTIPPALMITERDRPGKCPANLRSGEHMSYNKIKVIGALYNLRKSIKPTSFFYHLEMCTCTVFLYFFPGLPKGLRSSIATPTYLAVKATSRVGPSPPRTLSLRSQVHLQGR